ncbi:MAG: hypothetical protein WC456_02975 [Patescibacteria group bacterium]
MFKKKKKIEQNTEIISQLNQEMVVHNMPKASKLGDIYAVGAAPAVIPVAPPIPATQPSAPVRANFKATGVIIMVAGFLVIAGLVYLSYRFIIAPSTETGQGTVVPDVTPAIIPAATSVEPVMPSTDIATIAPLIDLATTTVVTPDEEPEDVDPLLFPDADKDGLNDGEEALLGTTATSTDSDSDGYSDFAETINGYDPTGAGKISANAQLAKHANQAFSYELLYPKGWPIQTLNGDATTIFTAPDNSLIQVSVQDNPNQSGILSWYEESFPNLAITYDKVRSTYSWEGIMGESGLNFYLTDKQRSNIFVISYIPALESRIAYPTIFQLMINSIFIK